MDTSEVRIVGAGSGGAVAAALSWIHLLGEVIQVLASILALVASGITIYMFIRAQRKGTSATIQSKIEGPVGELRSEITVDPKRGD